MDYMRLYMGPAGVIKCYIQARRNICVNADKHMAYGLGSTLVAWRSIH